MTRFICKIKVRMWEVGNSFSVPLQEVDLVGVFYAILWPILEGQRVQTLDIYL